MGENLPRSLVILVAIAAILSACFAAVALIPAFGQWLSPREPVSNPGTGITPTFSTVEESPVFTADPQVVDWEPNDSMQRTGMRVIDNEEFIPWEKLKPELEQNVLAKVSKVQPGSTLALADLPGRINWIVQVIEPGGNVIAHVWIGKNPLKNWGFDGLIRVGDPNNPIEVWSSFQRYSDGSYQLR